VNPLRVAIWAAVSSQAQAAKDKDSLDSQKRDGRLWADQVGGQATHVFEVPGQSRDHIFFHDAAAKMDAYARLRRACEQREFDVLWCRSRDRLGRTDALIAQVEALVGNAGASVYSALMPSPIDKPSEASSIYMSAIERAQSEVETVQRVRRTRVGHKARVRNGLPHGGPPPYGYRYVRDRNGEVMRLAPAESEAGALHLIAEKYTAGWGLNRILQALNASLYQPRRAESWAKTSVYQMLRNPIYAGYTHYGELETKSDLVEPLWDDETWRAIQRESASRDSGGREIATALSGICFCARCGHAMVHGRGADYEYYRCTVHAHKSFTGRTCHPNNTRQTKIARALSSALTPPIDGADIEALIQDAAPDLAHLDAERERLREAVRAIEEKRKRLAIALADGVMEAGPYRAADGELVERLEAILARIQAIDRKLASQPTMEERATAVRDLLAYWRESDGAWLLEERHKHELNAILRQIGARVLCEDCEVVAIAFTG